MRSGFGKGACEPKQLPCIYDLSTDIYLATPFDGREKDEKKSGTATFYFWFYCLPQYIRKRNKESRWIHRWDAQKTFVGVGYGTWYDTQSRTDQRRHTPDTAFTRSRISPQPFFCLLLWVGRRRIPICRGSLSKAWDFLNVFVLHFIIIRESGIKAFFDFLTQYIAGRSVGMDWPFWN